MSLKRFFILVLYGVFSFIQAGKAANIDSLQNVLKVAFTDENEAEILYAVGRHYDFDDFQIDSALKYYQLALSVVKNDTLKADIIYDLGFAYKYSSNFNKSITYFQSALELYFSLNDSTMQAGAYHSIAGILELQTLYQQALEYYKKAVKINLAINNTDWLINNYANLTGCYKQLMNYPKSLEMIYKTKKLCLASGDSLSYYDVLLVEAGIYQTLHDSDNFKLVFKEIIEHPHSTKLDEVAWAIDVGNLYFEFDKRLALKHYLFAYNLALEIKNPRQSSAALCNAGVTYRYLNIDSAVYCLKKSIEIDLANGLNAGLGSNYCDLAVIYLNSYQLPLEAIKYAELAQPLIFNTTHLEHQANVAEISYEGYLAVKDYKNAFKWLKIYQQINDSIESKQNIREVTIKQQQFLAKQQALTDSVAFATQTEIDQIKYDKEITQQRTYTFAGIGGAVLMLILALVSVKAYATKKRSNAILNQQNIAINEQKLAVEKQRDTIKYQKQVLEEKNQEITDSLNYAKRLQQAILPPPRLVKEWLTESFIFYKPKDIVAGDFYWMENLPALSPSNIGEFQNPLLLFAVADCTGHGVPGAMVSVVCANALNAAVKEHKLRAPHEILTKVSELVTESFAKSEETIQDGMDIALCALDISAKIAYFCGANNPLYVVTKTTKSHTEKQLKYSNETHVLCEYKAVSQPIGAGDKHYDFETKKILLNPGDAIYLFSDGFPDQFGGVKGKKYKYGTFKKALLSNSQLPMDSQKALLINELENWQGDLEQIDDICVVGIKINGVERDNFTKRELEVLVHLQKGLPSKLIASELNISVHTVDTYRRRMLAKTGTFNTIELINYCIKKEVI